MVGGALHLLAMLAKQGKTTKSLDEAVFKYIQEKGGQAAFKGYRGYPANICTSVNEEVVHGIPGKRTLKAGDILSVDIGVCYKGYYADAALTLPIGHVKPEAQILIDVTRESLCRAIRKIKAGAILSELSVAIQDFVESNQFSVVRDLVGHGIGSALHEDPQIPNYVDPNVRRAEDNVILKEGMMLAIEPMVNQGGYDVETLDNGWTVVTKDRKLSAHFEHTVLVKENGGEIMTAVTDY
jgi:methionyl aminopeptidase